jgi:uncharacterized protein (DUF1330 family)
MRARAFTQNRQTSQSLTDWWKKMKKAYCIVNILQINDQEKFTDYIAGHIPTIEQYGGKFLVKGGAGEILEGDWPSTRIVIHEFPSLAQFKQWYNSAEYRPWKALRQSCAEVNVIVSEGL